MVMMRVAPSVKAEWERLAREAGLTLTAWIERIAAGGTVGERSTPKISAAQISAWLSDVANKQLLQTYNIEEASKPSKGMRNAHTLYPRRAVQPQRLLEGDELIKGSNRLCSRCSRIGHASCDACRTMASK